MAETIREMVVRLSMDAGAFKKTASNLRGEIRNIDKEIRAIGDASDEKVKLMSKKLDLQKKSVDNLKGVVDQARKTLENADTAARKLLAAKELSGLESDLRVAEQAAKDLENQIKRVKFDNLKEVGGQIKGIGRKMSMYITAPLAALGLTSMNVFKEYEMAATVLETKLDGSAGDAERLSAAALEMSETIPVAYTEIMAIMTSLAAAGVPTEKIEGMTLALAQMSAVTGMSADEVGTSMVLFMNAMNEPFENIDQLGAALVELADASIATETSIFDMATRMAATGGLAGMSAVDVFSLAAAFSSMGVNAEAGGTAASKLMKIMQVAADTGTKSEMFTDTMGLSFEEFSQQWKEFPAQTMLGFFQGLQNMDMSGQQSVLSFLDEVGLTEVRLSNLVALGAKNPDMFKDLLDVGDTGFAENLALVEKSDKIFNTASGQMDVFSNKMKNAQAEVGDNVADALTPVLEKIANVIGKFGELDEATQGWIVNAGLGLAVGGPLLVGLGSVMQAVGTIGGMFISTGAQGAAGLGMILGPLGTLVALVAAAYGIYQAMEGSVAALDTVEQAISGDKLPGAQAAIDGAQEMTPELEKANEQLAKYRELLKVTNSEDFSSNDTERMKKALGGLSQEIQDEMFQGFDIDQVMGPGSNIAYFIAEYKSQLETEINAATGEATGGIETELSAPIASAVPGVQSEIISMGKQLAVEAATQAAAVSAAWSAGLNFNTPTVGSSKGGPGSNGSSTTNVTINGAPGTPTGNYAVVRQVTDAVKRVNRGYGK